VRLTVAPEDEGARLDALLAGHVGSRTRAQRLIDAGQVLVNGAPAPKRHRVRAGEVVDVDDADLREPLDAGRGEPAPHDVVWEDEHLLVVDKPAGVVVHPAAGHRGGTLVQALAGRAAGGDPMRPGIVHRLDRDTSGLIMVAKHDAAQSHLMALLKARRVKKTYLALVHGQPAAAVGRIEAPIGRDPRQRMRMGVVPDGRPAVTGYRVRERFDGWSLLELDLVTGRTHQIRVHLASIGHPVAGDPIYATGLARRGPDGLARLFLHAWRLELAARDGERLIRAVAPLPDELESVLAGLRTRSAGATA